MSDTDIHSDTYIHAHINTERERERFLILYLAERRTSGWRKIGKTLFKSLDNRVNVRFTSDKMTRQRGFSLDILCKYGLLRHICLKQLHSNGWFKK